MGAIWAYRKDEDTQMDKLSSTEKQGYRSVKGVEDVDDAPKNLPRSPLLEPDRAIHSSPRRLLKLHQVANLLQCSIRNIYRLLAEKKLPVLRIGGLTRIRPEDLNDFLLRHQEHHHVSQSTHSDLSG